LCRPWASHAKIWTLARDSALTAWRRATKRVARDAFESPDPEVGIEVAVDTKCKIWLYLIVYWSI
jgi:hypothetical protein